jgi:hypothetical protein
MSSRWQAAVGYALVGIELSIDEPGHPDPDAVVVALSQAGWTAQRIGDHARWLVAAEQVWPHPVPAALRDGCGAAQFAAAVGRTRALIGLTTLETRGPSTRTIYNADELRLLREVPPHHGS